MANITVEDIKKDIEVSLYLNSGTVFLSQLGYTEHGKRHASIISDRAYCLLSELGYQERECQLAAIAGYMHDIGNMINRYNHGITGAVMAFTILTRMKMDPSEIAFVISAIGNHEEEKGNAVNPIAAALILADKSDVHRERVTTKEFAKFEIHDRVNYAAEKSKLVTNLPLKTITLEVSIDTSICPVMEYFEIFLARMIMSRRAAEFLGCQFHLVINQIQLL